MEERKNHAHLTAKEREKMSFPSAWLLRNGFLKDSILDFGCGYGKDVKELQSRGYSCQGFDPFHFPKYPRSKFDIILCHYVLNVLKPNEQQKVLMEISSLLKPGGRAYFTVRRDLKYEGFRVHKVHKKTTYQCNVKLPFYSLLQNDFCEIYSFQRFPETQSPSSCPFCSLNKKVVYIAENLYAFAFFDGYPVSEGHALVLPKRHVEDYFQLTQKEQFYCWNLVNFVKDFVKEKSNPDGFNVGINVGEAAGQSVFHAHIHVIPRYKGDVEKPKGGVRHVIKGRGYY